MKLAASRLFLTDNSIIQFPISYITNGAHRRHLHLPRKSESTSSIERRKHPRRGGQNLSDRFRRLEKTLREKESLSNLLDYSAGRALTPLPVAVHDSMRQASEGTFRSLVIPVEPKPPESDECCMSGCAVCVYDLYEESVGLYRQSLKNFRDALIAMDVPQSEWPLHTRYAVKETSFAKPPSSVSLSAFDEMERRLQEKRERAAAESRS